MKGSGRKGEIAALHPWVVEETRAGDVSRKSDSTESDDMEPVSLKSGSRLSSAGVEFNSAKSNDGKYDSIAPSSSKSEDSQVDVDPRAPVATKTFIPVRIVVAVTVATLAGRAAMATPPRRAASALSTPDGRGDEPAESRDSGGSAG